MIVALIGPSGAGKSTVARLLSFAGEVRVVPTYTTRPRRPEERRRSVDHRFCNDREFDAMLAAGRFAATGALPGLDARYGLPRLPERAGRPLLVIARAHNVETVRRLGHRTLVYQVEAPRIDCDVRLVARAISAAELDARSRVHASELIDGRRLADRVFVNDDTANALVTAVATAIREDWR